MGHLLPVGAGGEEVQGRSDLFDPSIVERSRQNDAGMESQITSAGQNDFGHWRSFNINFCMPTGTGMHRSALAEVLLCEEAQTIFEI
jgi:hypothetical protein